MKNNLKIVGLAMTMNEEDIIEESFTEHCKYYDQIVVMDNSTDKTPELLKQFPQVVKIFKQSHHYDSKISGWDFMREVPLQYIKSNLPRTDWISLIHGDEIPHDNPIKAVEMADKAGKECIWWKTAQFYFHESEKNRVQHEDLRLKIQLRRLWYAVNWVELRQFRYYSDSFYKYGVFPFHTPGIFNIIPILNPLFIKYVSPLSRK